MKERRADNSGVTMIELIVVIALIAVLGTALFPLIKTIYDSWQIADRRVEVLQVGRIGMSKINREIRTARDLADVSNAAMVDYYPTWASSTQYRINFSTSSYAEFSPVTPYTNNMLAGPIDSANYVTYTRRLTTGNAVARRIASLFFKYAVSDERRILPANLSPMEFRTFANIRTSREGYYVSRTNAFASETFKFSQKVADAQNVCFKAFCDRIDRLLPVAANATVTCSPGPVCAAVVTPLAYVAVGDYYAGCVAATALLPIQVVGAPGSTTNRKLKIVLSNVGGETCTFFDGLRVERFP